MFFTGAGSEMLGKAGLGSYGWIRARTCHRSWTDRRWNPELGGKATMARLHAEGSLGPLLATGASGAQATRCKPDVAAVLQPGPRH